MRFLALIFGAHLSKWIICDLLGFPNNPWDWYLYLLIYHKNQRHTKSHGWFSGLPEKQKNQPPRDNHRDLGQCMRYSRIHPPKPWQNWEFLFNWIYQPWVSGCNRGNWSFIGIPYKKCKQCWWWLRISIFEVRPSIWRFQSTTSRSLLLYIVVVVVFCSF